MRVSCNGCRVLRKGCSDDCVIRPCLQWIKSPESQANATLFLAKFFGRAGLINLIEASPLHLRPATFWSLLHEACGRILCPVYGSAGLLGSGNWAQCQSAVEAVLKGSPIGSSQLMPPPPLPTDAREAHVAPPSRPYDIRHVSQDNTRFSAQQHPVRNRPRFKQMSIGRSNLLVGFNNRFDRTPGGFEQGPAVLNSSVSWPGNSSTEDQESLFSVETVEGTLVKRTEPDRVQTGTVDLDLTLGIASI